MPRRAASRVTQHRLCPAECRCQPPCGLQLQGTYHCAVFVLLLSSTARSSGTIATIRAEVLGVFAAGCGSILNDLVLLALDAAAAGRRSTWLGAAKRRPRALCSSSRAAAGFGRLGRHSRAFFAALAALRGSSPSSRVAPSVTLAMKKSAACHSVFLDCARAHATYACTARQGHLFSFHAYMGCRRSG